jgi:hypothetical protein
MTKIDLIEFVATTISLRSLSRAKISIHLVAQAASLKATAATSSKVENYSSESDGHRSFPTQRETLPEEHPTQSENVRDSDDEDNKIDR